MTPQLTAARLVLAFASAIVYALVAHAVGRRRPAAPDARMAIRAFQVWWLGLALISGFNPLMTVLDRVGGVDLFPARVFLLEAVLLALMIAVGGLLYYLLYVWSGKIWVIWPVAAYTFLEMTWLLTVVTQAHPVAYGPQCPGAAFCYEQPFTGTPAQRLLSLSLSIPFLLGTGAYFLLYFRLRDPLQRRRVAMVAGALAVWFGSGLVASLVQGTFETADGTVASTNLNQSVYWSFLIAPAISLAASLVVLWAYRLEARAVAGSQAEEPSA